MNLFEFYQDVTQAIPSLILKSEYLSAGAGDTPYATSNLSALRKAINSVENIKYLQDDITALRETWLYSMGNDSVRVTTVQKNEVQNLLTRLQIKLSTIKDITEDFSDFNRDDLLFVKLPELQSFDELTKFSSDLKKGIELPVLEKEIQGQVNIISAGSGSIVLYITLGTVLAVKLIAGVCWAAAVIRKKSAEAKIFEQHAKTLELKNEAFDSLVEAQKIQLKNILDSEAQSIAAKNFSHKDQETIERLKLSITTISELIDKGAKILPMSQNEDIQKAFPDYSRLNLIESTIKQITEGQK